MGRRRYLIKNKEKKKTLNEIAYGMYKGYYGDKAESICKVLLEYDKNDKSIDEILLQAGISRRTLFNYITKFKKDYMFMINKKRKKRSVELEKYKDLITENLNNEPVRTYREAKERIQEITGIDRGITQTKEFLDHCKFKKKDGFYISKSKKKEKFSLKSNIDEIIDFLENSTPTSMNMAIRMLREKFPLIEEEDYQLYDIIEKHTTL